MDTGAGFLDLFDDRDLGDDYYDDTADDFGYGDEDGKEDGAGNDLTKYWKELEGRQQLAERERGERQRQREEEARRAKEAERTARGVNCQFWLRSFRDVDDHFDKEATCVATCGGCAASRSHVATR